VKALPAERRRWPVAAAVAALVLGLAGCMGYLRPFLVEDGRNLFLVLSAYSLDRNEAPRTLVFLRRSGPGGPWQRLADRAGTARAAAAWGGELWLFYPSACAALSLKNGDLAPRAVPVEPGWEIQAAAVHRGELWVLGTRDAGLVCVRRGPGSDSWETPSGELFLGGAVTQMAAASSGERLWLLWRKRDADGQPFPETFSACWQEGRWTLGPARDIGRSRLAAAADPAGGGVLVAVGRRSEPKWLPRSSDMVLYRLDPSGWTELPPTGAAWREPVSVLLGPAVLGRPASLRI
jgi:hypothetical protein